LNQPTQYASLINSCETGHSKTVNRLIFIENDSKYITCSWDESINIFDARNNKLIKKLQGHTGAVKDITMLTNGYLASCSNDYSIKLWNLQKGTCLKTLHHLDQVNCIIEASNSILISGAFDKTITFWDLNCKDSPCSPIKVVQDSKQDVVFFHSLCLLDEYTFAAGSRNDINIYKMSYLPSFAVILEKQLVGHTEFVKSTQVTKNKEVLISVSDDSTCRSWCISSGKCLRTFTGHSGWILGLLVLSETRFVTSASDGELKFWKIDSKTSFKTLKEKGNMSITLAKTNDSRLFSCGSDGKIRIYKI